LLTCACGKPDTTRFTTALYTVMVIRLGYPAQNLTLPATTNRTLRLASLSDAKRLKGLVRENVADLRAILRWNAEHGVGLFRMGQSLIPFASHPAFPYDWEAEHGDDLREAGELARDLGIRLSMHPGQYIHPGSPKPEVVERSLMELRYVTGVLDLLGSPEGVAVLHMGGAYEDRPASAERFIQAMRPEAGILRYLALENDERVWTAAEVVGTARVLGIPAILDVFHHGLNPGGLTMKEALDLSLPTWKPRGVRPKLHLSSQDPAKRPGAHAYSVDARDWKTLVEALGGRETDVMVEAKGKEYALAPLGVDIG
jgi:UV DNA damage endonuclease